MTHYFRPWTAEVVRGTRFATTRNTLKRACSGCQTVLGDVTDREVQGSVSGAPLPDTKAECGVCNGLHVLAVDIEHIDESARLLYDEAREYLRDPEITYSAVCPHADNLDDNPYERACALWWVCGCEAPAIPSLNLTQPTTPEQRQAQLDAHAARERIEQARCPKSPTGKHQWFPHADAFLAPTDRCIVAAGERIAEAGGDLTSTPGRYPVDFDVEDDGVVLRLVSPPFTS
jgi:hypothetical protein